jgi:hypothetical protein
VATILVVVTLGLAFPLLFSPTAFVYLLCLMPLALFWRNRNARVPGAIAAVAIVGAVALTPAYLSWQREHAIAGSLADLQVKPSKIQAFRSIELLKHANFSLDLSGSDFQNDACDSICRSLIEHGEVDWIRVVIPTQNGDKPANVTLFVSGSGKDCAVPGSSSPSPANCVLIRADHGLSASLTLRLEDGYGNGIEAKNEEERHLYAAGWRRISAYDNTNGKSEKVLLLQEQSFQVAVFPTIITPGISGLNSGGFELEHRTIRILPIDYAEAYRLLGFRAKLLVPAQRTSEEKTWRREPTDSEIRDLISVLDLPGSESFNQAQSEIVDRWTRYARIYKVWNADRLELARRILADNRVEFTSWFDQVFAKPEVATALLPIVLDEVESSNAANPRHAMKQALWHMPQLEPGILKANSAQIIKIIEAQRYGDFGPSFLATYAVIGENPLPLLDKMAGKDGAITKIRTLCLAEPRASVAYIQRLREEFEKSQRPGDWPEDETEAALNALVLHGDDNFVQSAIDTSQWRHKDKMFRRLTANRDDERRSLFFKCQR